VSGLETRLQVVACYAAELWEFGPATFLYSDGELLFGPGHRRMQADGRITLPGPTVVTQQDALPAAGVRLQTELGPPNLTLFASVP
jgi:hypothetical protein